MSADYVKIPARAIQELLAGTISQELFLKQNYLVPSTPGSLAFNPFARAQDDGRVIARITVERCPDDDDDWLIFHFSPPDAAVAPFRVP